MKKLPFYFTAEEVIKQGRTTQEHVNILKEWLANCDYNFNHSIQDELIVIFLLSCNNDIPLTKNTIKMYYQCKKDSPEIFDNRDMEREEIKAAMNTVYMSSLPIRTDENYAVHYFKLADTNYLHFDLVPLMKLSYMLLDITQERNLPNGLVVLLDMKGVGLMHLSRIKLNFLKKYFQFLQEGFPLQLKVIHIVNAVYFFDKIMSLIKLCTKSEIIEMIKIYAPNTSQEKLFKLIPKKCWPADYGGELPSAETLHQKTWEQFKKKQDFWMLEEEIRHDTSNT
ncbi:hypothetical protein ABEB36_007031 [Hypothenemus hampei]|uniref:CRAL-TRIO domain-containing protein n=1 Tax=Hypothenemus hampei TaxID=57062 RepID=A0ABD1EVM1_HYPHA